MIMTVTMGLRPMVLHQVLQWFQRPQFGSATLTLNSEGYEQLGALDVS